jgi:serine/threonine protein kinase
MEIYKGKLVASRFELVRKLGAGGMGEVWLANDRELGEEVALKFVLPHVGLDSRAVSDLKREVAVARKLTHENIVRVHDIHSEDDTYFVAMEYIAGETLNGLLDKYQRNENRNFTVKEVLYIAERVCPALDYAHDRRVIHRDMKPGNIMLSRKREVKLLDFGIARTIADSVSRISRTKVEYTPGYAAPEQLIGRGITRAVDIYALGATFYDLLAGRPPFHTGDITYQTLHLDPEPLAGMPRYVNDAILTALNKDYAERFNTASDFYRAVSGKKKVRLPRKAKKPVKPDERAVAKTKPAAQKPERKQPALLSLISEVFTKKPPEPEKPKREKEVRKKPVKEKKPDKKKRIKIKPKEEKRPAPEKVPKRKTVSGVLTKGAVGLAVVGASALLILFVLTGVFIIAFNPYSWFVGGKAGREPAPAETSEGHKTLAGRGKEEDIPTVSVIDVRGLSEREARDRLSSGGFSVGTVSEDYSSTVGEGDVISQSLEPGSEAADGAEVNLVISLGPRPTGGGTAPSTGRTLPSGDTGTGAPKIPKQRYCYNCGEPLPAGVTYCPACGAKN